ncbi:MAG: hypothetical protein ACRCY4_05290 [Brevinema sp.]
MTKMTSQMVLSRRMEYVFTAVLIVAGALAPSLVHMAGGKGTVLLPIFFALSLGAGMLSLPALLSLAIIVPLSNHILFGMPPVPMLYILTLESVIMVVLTVGLRRTQWMFPVIFALAFIVARLVGSFVLMAVSGLAWHEGLVNSMLGLVVNIGMASAVFMVSSTKNHG